MKLSEYIKQKHAEQYKGIDDDMGGDFINWWNELEPEDLDEIAEEWFEEREHGPSNKYQIPGYEETRENLSKLTIRK